MITPPTTTVPRFSTRGIVELSFSTSRRPGGIVNSPNIAGYEAETLWRNNVEPSCKPPILGGSITRNKKALL
ncbi:MAG: hypothetical protein ACTSVI_05555 [Promethearchaeota archaeon]